MERKSTRNSADKKEPKPSSASDTGLPTVKPNKFVSRNIEKLFTDDEIIQFGKDLVGLRHDVEELEKEKKASNKSFADKISAKEVEMAVLDSYIETGKSEEPVECEVFLNMPNTGKKTIERRDTNETVAVEDMTQEELQVHMDFKHADGDEEDEV